MVDALNGQILTGKVETSFGNGASTNPKIDLSMNPDEFVKEQNNTQSNNEDKQETLGSTLKGCLPFLLLFEGLPLIKFMKNGGFKGKLYQGLNKANQDALGALKTALKSTDLTKADKFKKVVEYIGGAKESREAFRSVKSATSKAAKATKLSEKMAKASGSKLERLNAKCAKAASDSLKSADKVDDAIKVIKGGNKAVEAGAKATGKLGKIGKFMKSSGAGVMLVFSGVIEMLTEVVPTFKELGKEKGMKQLGKSAVKVGLDTAGFIGGEALCTAIGTAICPGIGTVAGAILGFVGGMLGSFVAGKVSKALVGQSEREIAAKEAEKNITKAPEFKAEI